MGGINWMSLVEKGITGGISSAISGTASDIACYGLAWGLDTIFGLQVGRTPAPRRRSTT